MTKTEASQLADYIYYEYLGELDNKLQTYFMHHAPVLENIHKNPSKKSDI